MKIPQESRLEGRFTFPSHFPQDSAPASTRRMPVVCAWCEQVIEEGPGPVSHGMCPECHAAFLAMLPED